MHLVGAAPCSRNTTSVTVHSGPPCRFTNLLMHIAIRRPGRTVRKGVTAKSPAMHALDAVCKIACVASTRRYPSAGAAACRSATRRTKDRHLLLRLAPVPHDAVSFRDRRFFGRRCSSAAARAVSREPNSSGLALPLFVFWPIVISGIVACMIWGAVAMNGGTLPRQGAAATRDHAGHTFPLTHL